MFLHYTSGSGLQFAMAPLVIQAAGGSATKEFKKESGYARLLGSGRPPVLCLFLPKVMLLGSAGVAELAIFHPVPFSMAIKSPGDDAHSSSRSIQLRNA